MERWPNVPDVYGWLRLDRRGNWLLKVAPGHFERIGNTGLVQFISRNYESDAQGRWYFQNGPQRVFVGLDYTPHVYRLGEQPGQWVTQSGVPAGNLQCLLFDDRDQVVLAADAGPGIVDDRDLPALLDGLHDGGGVVDAESLIQALRASGSGVKLRLSGQAVHVEAADSAALPGRFGYIPEPAPETVVEQENA